MTLEPRKYRIESAFRGSKDYFEVERLLLNQIKTPDGTIMTSTHVHDFRTYTDKNGKTYMVDGGNEYLKRNLHVDHPYEELSVYVTADHEANRQAMTWGTYGPNGDQPVKYLTLAELDTDHIYTILRTQKHVPEWKQELFEDEIRYRFHKELVKS